MKRIIKILISEIIWFVGQTLKKVFPSKKRSTQNKLLLIRTDAIGDFVLFSPMLRKIKEKYEDYEIDIIIPFQVIDLVKNCPYINEIIEYNKKKYSKNIYYRFLLLIQLFRNKYNICIYPVYYRITEGDEMVLWANAEINVGWDSEGGFISQKEKLRGNKLYSKLLKYKINPHIHEIEKYHLLTKVLGIDDFSYLHEYWYNRNSIDHIELFWDKNKLYNKNVIALIPGSSVSFRAWGKNKYQDLINRIYESDNETVFIIVGGNGEYDYNDEITRGCPKSTINVSGLFPLNELNILFKKCKVVIGNDTGPMHVAISIKIPTICVLGGGQFGQFMPWGEKGINHFVYKKMDCFNCNWNCKYNSFDCITGITVEAVYKIYLSIVQQNIIKYVK